MTEIKCTRIKVTFWNSTWTKSREIHSYVRFWDRCLWKRHWSKSFLYWWKKTIDSYDVNWTSISQQFQCSRWATVLMMMKKSKSGDHFSVHNRINVWIPDSMVLRSLTQVSNTWVICSSVCRWNRSLGNFFTFPDSSAILNKFDWKKKHPIVIITSRWIKWWIICEREVTAR